MQQRLSCVQITLPAARRALADQEWVPRAREVQAH